MILIDTSAWIHFFTAKDSTSNLVDRLIDSNQAAVCGPILTEIQRGFTSERERDRYMPLFEGCRQLTQPDRLWAEAGELGFMLRKINRKLKTLDLLIACYALAHHVPLLTLDADFSKIRVAKVPLNLVSIE